MTNKYPLQLEKEFYRTLQADYQAEMKEVLQAVIRDLSKDELLKQRETKQDSFMNLMGFLGKKIFNIEFASSANSDKLLGNLVGNFTLLDSWVTSKFNEGIVERIKTLETIRPKQMGFVNGQWKEIRKPLEKFQVFENGKLITKYKTEELAINVRPATRSLTNEQLKQKATNAANLVKGIKAEKAIELQNVIREAYYSGKTKDEIVGKIGKLIEGGEKRLNTIARDQVSKFASEVNRDKANKAGVKKFIWRTLLDDAVRDSHRDLEGLEFDYVTGAQGLLDESTSKFPGDDYQCRCYEEPIF